MALKRTARVFSVVFLVIVLLISACSGGGEKEESGNADSGGTSSKFNEGIVDYRLEKLETFVDPFDEEKLGTLVTENDKGVSVIFDESFDDEDVTCGESAVEYSRNSCSILSGSLYVPAYEEGASAHGWTTWAPVDEVFSDDYIGVQISFDCVISADGDAAWSCPFIGLFKDSHNTIADNNTGGIYFSFNNLKNAITVYCAKAGEWNWPAGNCTVKVESGIPDEKCHIDVITAGRELVRILIDGRQVLEMVLSRADGSFEVFDENNKKSGKGHYDSEIIAGPYLQFFSHMGIIGIDNLKVLACTKGARKVENTVTATPVEGHKLGLDITDKKDVISICYSVWHNAINGTGTGPIKNISDVTEMLKTYDFTAEKGFVNKETGETNNALTKFHYWGRPAQGYYRSSDVNAIRSNMNLIYAAGVDFIILDFTYATAPGYAPGSSTWEAYINSSVTPLLDTIMLMRAEGRGTPYVVFWMGNDSMFEYMDEYFLSKDKWKDCFVYWDGKPFMMKWEMDSTESYEKWTIRGMCGLRGTADINQWSYLEIDNSKAISYDRNGDPEHMCVDVATQETYMSSPTAHGRQGGKFFYEQWKNAFAVHPKIVTVTWWNEWCAQLYHVDGVGYIFTDNFNEEYSRDIEPEDGKNGDTYYKWLCKYAEEYRKGGKCPKLIEN